MHAIQRQKRIKELILSEQKMKISDLSQELGVSDKTILRDIQPLVEEGLIIRTFGGISLDRKKKEKDLEDDKCILCGRTIQERFSFRLILQTRTEKACCPHCGFLRYGQAEQDITQIICRDLLTQITINAQKAWYVWEPVLQIGCCQPQILIFEHKEHAERFVKGFAGSILSFDQTKEKISKEFKVKVHNSR